MIVASSVDHHRDGTLIVLHPPHEHVTCSVYAVEVPRDHGVQSTSSRGGGRTSYVVRRFTRDSESCLHTLKCKPAKSFPSASLSNFPPSHMPANAGPRPRSLAPRRSHSSSGGADSTSSGSTPGTAVIDSTIVCVLYLSVPFIDV